jgi:hypothetical protein
MAQAAKMTPQTGRRVLVATKFVEKFIPRSGPGPALDTLQPAFVNPPFLARITAVSGSFPTWSYTVQRFTNYKAANTGAARWQTDGRNITSVLNRCEFGPASGYPYTHGTGVTVTASDGTVNSGSCKMVAIGIGSTVEVRTDLASDGTLLYSFYAANSAQ